MSETYNYKPRSWWDTSGLPRLGDSVPRSERTELIVHHTVTIDPDSSPVIWETDDEIKAHMLRLQTIRPDLGLDFPYNFGAFIRPDWSITICEGRGFDRSGAHTKYHNRSGLATSFAGNFEQYLIGNPEVVLVGLNAWFAFQKEIAPNLGPIIFGHRDYAQTVCPGQHLYALKPRWTWQVEEDDMTPDEVRAIVNSMVDAAIAEGRGLANGVLIQRRGDTEVYKVEFTANGNRLVRHIRSPQAAQAHGISLDGIQVVDPLVFLGLLEGAAIE